MIIWMTADRNAKASKNYNGCQPQDFPGEFLALICLVFGSSIAVAAEACSATNWTYGMNTEKPTRAYTVKQVRALLNMSNASLYARINSGELQSFLIGRSRRISDSALSDFISNLEKLAEIKL